MGSSGADADDEERAWLRRWLVYVLSGHCTIMPIMLYGKAKRQTNTKCGTVVLWVDPNRSIYEACGPAVRTLEV